MADDLIQRLRDEQTDGWAGDACAVSCALADEAAARIEALEAENTRLRALLKRCQTVLGNMAKENEGAIFYRWPIPHEALRADARHLLPLIDEALTPQGGV